MRPSRVLGAGIALLCAAVTAAVPGHAADRPHPATFRVGAAVRSIDPTVPVYAGGFGASPPIRKVVGSLQVRALYISNGRHAVAFASVDSQAYFAAYQEGPDLGISSARDLAAAALSRIGPAVTPADIIVQGTHSHSAATLEGIWGPVPLQYLRLVHDRTVAALVAAARAAMPAYLQFATYDAPWLDNIETAQYDSFPGWSQDGQLSVLRAVSTGTGRTVATYVNVPAHPDIVCGACLKELTADYFGAVRDSLDRSLGGVTVASPATLGREESPVQATGIAEMKWYAEVVTSVARHALTTASWITDPTLAATESMASIPGANAALLGLDLAWSLPDSAKQQMLAVSGEYPIDRSMAPPYLTGAVIGTPLTAIRVGPVVYASMPGEPFPEVRLNLAAAVTGARAVVALSKGQDDLGYFYPSWVEPFTAAYPTDQGTFSVAPQAGDQILQDQLANIRSLGFTTEPVAVPAPLPARYTQVLRPGLQALASPTYATVDRSGTARVVLQAIYAPANTGGAPLAGGIDWDFGDGTTARSGALSFGGACGYAAAAGVGPSTCPGTGPAFVVHRFGPGTYTVRLRGRDTAGDAVAWTLTVVVGARGQPV